MTRTAPSPRLAAEPLEDRLAPAVAAEVIAGALVVTTDDADQRVAVDLDPLTGQILVRDAGLVVGRFDPAGISEIGISTGDGNDRVDVSPQITLPVSVSTGGGRDVVKGGGGSLVVDGGDAADKLGGGSATADLRGAGGDDRLVAALGNTRFDGGTGVNALFAVKTADVVVPSGGTDLVLNAPDPLAAINAQLAALSVPQETITTDEVQALLDRASAATPTRDAIIVVTDRNGRILGVRVEDGVAPEIVNNTEQLVFAIDGALSKARTGAFFGNNQAPLTSRTVRFISQSTITDREVNSNPNITDPNSTLRGPGYVAPVSSGGHFPPGITNTPQVDLFGIEHTNRDGTLHPGPDRIKGTADDVPLPERFNIDPAFVPPGQSLFPPDSYGFVSGLLPTAQNRGIATIPGGIPIFKNGQSVGGIGVFFPGKTGFASEENYGDQGALNDPSKPNRALEAEYIAFAAVGGAAGSGFSFPGPIGNAPALPAGYGLPFARIDLVGITLDVFGPGGLEGPKNLFAAGQALGVGTVNGANQVIGTNPDGTPLFLQNGVAVPEGWLVVPHDGVGITAAEATQIVLNGLNQQFQTRAAIRQLGSTAKFVFAVTDLRGEVIALYRTPDATVFSIDVAVAKARNVAYYANELELQNIDNIAGIPKGTAFTNRTFRYLAEPRFPEGIDGAPPGPFSIFNDGPFNRTTAYQIGGPLPASAFQSVLGFDSFNPQTNFRDPTDILNQNGIVFFPGSAPLYRGSSGALIGGLGVSGDGVDQDDVNTFFGSSGFGVPNRKLRADEVFVGNIRLPYQKFNRNPEGGLPQQRNPLSAVG